MICQQCHKRAEQPLELYDGGWACPHCKHGLMSAFSDFSVTRENEELFTLSERSYYRWLTNARRGQEGRTWLDKAVELCRESARLGNPLAVTRLGYYYDKDYVEENRSTVVASYSGGDFDLPDYIARGNNITYSVNKLFRRELRKKSGVQGACPGVFQFIERDIQPHRPRTAAVRQMERLLQFIPNPLRVVDECGIFRHWPHDVDDIDLLIAELTQSGDLRTGTDGRFEFHLPGEIKNRNRIQPLADYPG